jgi:hypothetical protein
VNDADVSAPYAVVGNQFGMLTPLWLKNTASRFGVVAVCAAALRGANVSRNGRPSVMPPIPRRNERRLRCSFISLLPGT